MNDWLDILRQRVTDIGVTRTAEEIGYNRTTVSLLLAGQYPANTARIQAAVQQTYGQVRCPWLEQVIPAAHCKKQREAPMPQSSATELRFWRCCQSCPNNPDREQTL